jgi:aminopeptidase N
METARNFISFRMDEPMSSYLVMLAIGKFRGEEVKSRSGVPILLYVRPQDEQKREPTFRYTKQIFDYFEREIGVNYPWKVYKQIPVTDFLYAGMENTSATLFSQDFVVDSIGYNDRNYINVNAHELAHQWFGDYVTAVSGTHHWLQEGFATYYALLAEEEIFGADHFSYKLYEMAEELQHASETDTIPILNPKASSLTFYKKGAWALHALRNEVGAENFRKAVKNYLNKYAFKNVTTENFLAEVKKVTPFNEQAFRQNWLENPKFEVKQAISILKKNSFVKQYLDILEMTNVPFEQKRAKFESIMTSNAYHPIKEEVIFQTRDVPFEQKQQLFNLAISTNDVRVRQVVANSISKVPESFYLQYTSLLNDPSYITREVVTNILWSQFPERRNEILNSTSSDIGFNDKNLRIQWLTLALITQGYKDDQKIKFYEELLSYGSPDYESSVRQNALTNLLYIDQNDKNVLAMLVRPLTHHRWQFSKFARDKIRELIKKDAHRSFYLKLLPTLEESEKNQLNRLLNP